VKPFDAQRERMVREQLMPRGITDARVLAACRRVPRHLFVPEASQDEAYADRPVAIGHEQTISQPYMVALTSQLLHLQGHERVLEIGTGSGYQLAILAELALEVYSIERVPELASGATQRLAERGYLNVRIETGDGTRGWAEFAPFDAIVVAAATRSIPRALEEQLADGGRLVIPVGTPDAQELVLAQKQGGRLHLDAVTKCLFVPLIRSEE